MRAAALSSTIKTREARRGPLEEGDGEVSALGDCGDATSLKASPSRSAVKGFWSRAAFVLTC